MNIAAMEEALLRYLPAEKVRRADLPAEEGHGSARLLPPGLYDIPQLDPSEGIRCCGGEEEYLNALEIFEQSIESKANGIEQTLSDPDLESYTIAVHSLKSTSRTVGASAVSELAKALEQAGNDGDIETIRTDTPRLLALYRSLKAPLQAILGRDTDRAESAALPLLPEAEFADALQSIRDMSAMFDDDSVKMILDMLAQYTIPEVHRAVYEKLRDAAERCDWDAVHAALTASGA